MPQDAGAFNEHHARMRRVAKVLADSGDADLHRFAAEIEACIVQLSTIATDESWRATFANPDWLADFWAGLCRLDSPLSNEDLLDARDEHVRAIARRFFTGSMYAIAKALSAEFAAYLSNGWLRERDDQILLGPAFSAKRRAWHHLAQLNDGESLGVSQITNILNGRRRR